MPSCGIRKKIYLCRTKTVLSPWLNDIFIANKNKNSSPEGRSTTTARACWLIAEVVRDPHFGTRFKSQISPFGCDCDHPKVLNSLLWLLIGMPGNDDVQPVRYPRQIGTTGDYQEDKLYLTSTPLPEIKHQKRTSVPDRPSMVVFCRKIYAHWLHGVFDPAVWV